MDNKTLTKLARFTAKKGAMPVLQKIAWDGCRWMANTLDQAITYVDADPVNLQPGCYDKKELEAWLMTGSDLSPDVPIEEFPPPAQCPKYGSRFPVDEEFMTRLTEAAMFCSTDENRIILQGVALRGNEVCGTDGRTLYAAEVGIATEEDVIIPSDSVRKMKGMTPFLMARNDRGAWFFTEDSVIWTKLVDGMFPNYRQVIPKEPGEYRADIPADSITLMPNSPDSSSKTGTRIRWEGNVYLDKGGKSMRLCNGHKGDPLVLDAAFVKRAHKAGATHFLYYTAEKQCNQPTVYQSEGKTIAVMPCRQN